MRHPFGYSLGKLVVAAFIGVFAAHAHAGPVILGGDDLTAHGSRTGAGVNLEGWLYIEKAVSNILTSETRPGVHDIDIAALGSAATVGFPGGNAGAAIGSAANVLGKTVAFFDGAAAITAFFASLAAGTTNPAMIWLAGTDAANDLVATEGAVLTANAAAINSFGASGGGLMSHGADSNTDLGIAYGWLSALLPGINAVTGCTAVGATLTPAGNAAFPGLSNSDVDSNAGPCHNHFTGDFGGLTTLAFDGFTGAGGPRSYIIGGGAGTVIVCGQPGQPPCPTCGAPGLPPCQTCGLPGQPECPIPVPGVLSLISFGLLGVLGVRRRKTK